MKKCTHLRLLFLLSFLTTTSLYSQWRGFSSVSENIKATDGVITKMRLEWSGSRRQIKAQLQGTMELFDDRPAIKKLSSGGSFVLEERKGKIYRKVRVQNGAADQLEYHYQVQAEPAIFSNIAKEWLESTLLEIVREAGINSRQRARAIYALSGENGILQEISKIERERSKRFYYERLLENETVGDSTLFKVANRIRSELSADANLKIVILEMINKHEMSDETFMVLLRATKEINNETTRASILIDIAAKLPHHKKARAYYHEIASAIESSIEKRRALSAAK